MVKRVPPVDREEKQERGPEEKAEYSSKRYNYTEYTVKQ